MSCVARDRLDRRGALATLAALVAALAGCEREEARVRVDLSRRGDRQPERNAATLRFAIGTMLSPSETVRDYKMLADYLAGSTGHSVQIVQRRGYRETNALIERGDADFAFVCTGAFVAIKPMVAELLVVPVVRGKTTYSSYIVVREEDTAKDLGDLRGSRFAFVDPLSLTGRIFPEWQAQQYVGDAGSLFGETVFSQSHSESINLVSSGRVRGAAVDSIVFEQLTRTEPARVSPLRILVRSGEFGMPPVIAGRRLDAVLRQILRSALLEAHLNTEGRRALAALGFDRFAPGDPKAYEAVATMQNAVLAAEPESLP